MMDRLNREKAGLLIGGFLLASLLLLPRVSEAQPGREQVERGNRLFAEEKYGAANNEYRDALLENPQSPIVQFNIGDVLYKKRQYEEALKAYDKATFAEDVNLQAQAYYNMGNTLYRLGQLPESIQAYKKALELNPNDEDAKYNLEFVRAKLKDMVNKQSQENPQQQENQERQQQQSGGGGEQEEQQQGQQQKPPGEEQQEQAQRQPQAEPQAGEQPQESQSEQGQQPQMAESQAISKEDAERILDALKNEDQELLQQNRVKKRAGGAYRGKDW